VSRDNVSSAEFWLLWPKSADRDFGFRFPSSMTREIAFGR
jgi:hypothetical protein